MDYYSIHWFDYVVFTIMLMSSVAIGVYFAFTGRKGSTEEYFVGSRKLQVVPTAISTVVTFTSAVSLLGEPVESYLYGGIYLLVTLASVFGTILAFLIYIPVLYPLRLTSVNEYILIRYRSDFAKYISTISQSLITVAYIGVVIFAPATVISSVMHFPVWAVIVVCGVVGIFYTSIGGLKAVIWTDTVQFVCMVAGILAVLIMSLVEAGGFSETFRLAKEGRRLEFNNFSLHPASRMTVWTLIFSSSIRFAHMVGGTQQAVQRFSSLSSYNDVKKAYVLIALGNILVLNTPILAGLTLYAYHAKNRCDPIQSGIYDSPNELVPAFVMEKLNYPGVPGVFMASLCAGALSTVSSMLNGASAVIWDDVLKHKFTKISQFKATFISKMLVVLFGFLSMCISFATMTMGGSILQVSLSLTGSLLIPQYAMLTLGIFCPWLNAKGVSIGSIVAVTTVLWIAFGSYTIKKYNTDVIPTITDMCFINQSITTTPEYYSTDGVYNSLSQNSTYLDKIPTGPPPLSGISNFYNITFHWYPLIGVAIVFVIGSLISLFTGKDDRSKFDNRCLLKPLQIDEYTQQDDDKHNGPDFVSGETLNPLIASKDVSTRA